MRMSLVRDDSKMTRPCARYAGWIGTIAARYRISDTEALSPLTQLEDSKYRLAVVAGTSTCHLVQVRGLSNAANSNKASKRARTEFLYLAYGVLIGYVCMHST